MNMNEEFVNVYIEVNNKKIEELIRGELLLQTRLSMAEKMIAQLNEENRSLQEKIEAYHKEKQIVKEDTTTNILSAFENKKSSKKDKEPESSVF